jgi:uncharacterized membrane protein HdeD (DUF308 family)
MQEPTPQLSEIAKKSKGALVFLGILCVIFGMVAIASPLFAGTMVTIVIGIFMLVAGISEAIHGTHLQQGKAPAIIKGLLVLTAGGLMLSKPLFGLAMLTMMMAIYFIIDGIMWCTLAIKSRPQPHWGMALFNGIITFVLGFMIWRSWPLSGVWAIGVLMGIRVMMAGWTLIFFGSVAGSVAKELEHSESC